MKASTRLAPPPLLLLSLIALGCDPGAKEPSKAAGSSEAVATAVPDPQGVRAVPALFPLGKPAAYALTLDSKLDLPGDGKSVQFRLTAELGVLRERSEQGAERLILSPVNPTVQGLGDSASADFSELQKELARAFEVELHDGSVEALRYPFGLSAFAVNIQRTIAAALQLASDGKGTATNWTTEREHDATGRYVAEYSIHPAEGGGTEVTRRKVRYSATVGSPARAPGAVELASAGVLPQLTKGQSRLLLRDGALVSLQHDEELRLEALGGAPVVSATHLELKRLDTPVPVSAASVPLERLGALEAYAPNPGAQQDALLDKARIGDWTFDKALAELEAVRAAAVPPAASGFSPEQLREREALTGRAAHAFVATEALIRSEKGTIGRVREAIAKGSTASRSLLDALGSSNTPEAQQTLLQVLADKSLTIEVRRRAATALGRADTPLPEVMSELGERLADEELWVNAAYTLGTLARKAREQRQSELSDGATEALVARLGSVKTSEQRLHALRSLANSGNVKALSAVKPYLADSDPTLRLGAVQATRLMVAPEVDALLAARFGVEERANVRKVLSDTLEMRPPSVVAKDAVVAYAMSKRGPSERAAAVKLLGHWRVRFPELDGALHELERAESDSKVREAARQALAGPAPPPAVASAP